MNWHFKNVSETLNELSSDVSSGLSSIDASSRLLNHGRNELVDRGGKSPWRILWEQFTSTMALILIGAALISGFIGSMKDCVTILAIVCLFALLCFFQEFKAERTMRCPGN